jgi:hypothetical protein
VDQILGLWLWQGSLSAYRDGALLGVMVSGLSVDLVWAVDMASGCTSVRVARKLPAGTRNPRRQPCKKC